MNAELDAVAEFLTGSHTGAGSLLWRALGNEDLRVVRRWAGEALPVPVEKRLLRELRHVIRTTEVKDDEPGYATARPSLLRPQRQRDVPAAIGSRPARLLLDLCRDASDATARRDRAILSLLLLAGLRRRELVTASCGDYDETDGRIEIKTARGGRRSVLLEGECRDDLERWLAERGGGGGPLFLAYDASGAPVPQGIAATTANWIVARRGAEAGIEGLTPTALRATFLRQLQAQTRQGAGTRGRYYLSEDGQPGWALPSLASI